MTATPPTSGPCTAWTTGAQIAALQWVAGAASKAIADGRLSQAQIDAIIAQAATGASEALYELSGRMFAGACGPVTIRPVNRPTDIDSRSLANTATGWFSSWGLASGYGSAQPGVLAHYAPGDPPTIRLPHPVSEIVQVKIDGTVIPAGEYELRSHRELVRLRTSASAVPTARYGWPTSQIPDLPDTEPGTFSVTIMFGAPPPALGALAALKLAEYLALPALGDTSRYPARTVQIARQGVTSQVANVIDVLAKGSLGIWEVDAFILAVNPRRNQRQAAVWSPDIGRNRRTAHPST